VSRWSTLKAWGTRLARKLAISPSRHHSAPHVA
jgi:hypothetical protein